MPTESTQDESQQPEQTVVCEHDGSLPTYCADRFTKGAEERAQLRQQVKGGFEHMNGKLDELIATRKTAVRRLWDLAKTALYVLGGWLSAKIGGR